MEFRNLFAIASNVDGLLGKYTVKRRTELTTHGISLWTEEIKNGILQGDCLFPMTFILSMLPLALILRKVRMCIQKPPINCQNVMDDLKHYSKSKSKARSLVDMVHTYIWIEFWLKKYSAVVLKWSKIKYMVGLTIP